MTSAFIPIKLNNERLPGKNIRLLGGKPLCMYVQEALLASRCLSRICVFCSDEHIREYLLPRVEFVKRPASLDTPQTIGNDIIRAFAEIDRSEWHMVVHATTPFLFPSMVRKMAKAAETGKYDSVNSMRRAYDLAWYDSDPVGFSANSVPRTQDMKPLYLESGGPHLYRREAMMRQNARVCANHLVVEKSYLESVDIDDAEDFEMAEALCGKYERKFKMECDVENATVDAITPKMAGFMSADDETKLNTVDETVAEVIGKFPGADPAEVKALIWDLISRRH